MSPWVRIGIISVPFLLFLACTWKALAPKASPEWIWAALFFFAVAAWFTVL